MKNPNYIDSSIELMKVHRYSDALHLLRQAIDQDPSQWNAWYMAGQCCRFLNDIDGAIEHLSRATVLKLDEAPIFLALGIAFQLNTQWDDAIEAFRRAIEIDSDYELAYNSLALTQKKCGDLDKALHNYDAGGKALARRIMKSMQNSRNSPIFKGEETVAKLKGSLWLEYALYAAYLSSSVDGIDRIAWQSGSQVLEEERTQEHAGLYWVDNAASGETVRLFLSNYFNTFCVQMKQSAAYSNLIGNRGTVLELLDRHDEAGLHFDEATEFLP